MLKSHLPFGVYCGPLYLSHTWHMYTGINLLLAQQLDCLILIGWRHDVSTNNIYLIQLMKRSTLCSQFQAGQHQPLWLSQFKSHKMGWLYTDYLHSMAPEISQWTLTYSFSVKWFYMVFINPLNRMTLWMAMEYHAPPATHISNVNNAAHGGHFNNVRAAHHTQTISWIAHYIQQIELRKLAYISTDH